MIYRWNTQAEVIDALVAEVTEIGRQEGLKEAREEGRREEREIMLEKLEDFLNKKGFGYILKTAMYDEFLSSLS